MIRFYHEVVVLSHHAFAILILSLVFSGMSLEKYRIKRLTERNWRRVLRRVSDLEE